MSTDVEENVRDYYGKTLKSGADLKTDACCDGSAVPARIKKALARVHDEVLARYYGCGLTVPGEVEGLSVLDLGSGSGRDCYVLSQLVGPSGTVTGIDMTDEQLAVAEKHKAFHAAAFGYGNVEFKKGNIERLGEVGLKDEQFDLIVSNCVINLAKDKEAVLREAYRTLKPGGELYFSDVYAERRVCEELRADPVLYGECLSGALYWNDFVNTAKKAGFTDPRLVESRPLAIGSDEVRAKIGHIRFVSATYRLFKIAGLESHCENYGQSVLYKGTMADDPVAFQLDEHHLFPMGNAQKVCGNTALMLSESRLKKHFDFSGDMSTHLGIYPDCGSPMPFKSAEDCGENGCCC